ncbi:sigma 54-interacting transcriptional regulator [Bacillus sp. CGMCC 1.16541]|uniref:sigma-54 interaction domain-containing protein n=1 Tax=Bacillus sp. CGMCC 1.16541 TaxID=2185143 RepID=UPI0013A5B3D0|nr:sigma 54-interacting transcriptional regulator [Bacillus sp. CGMCC 1.16541]
MRKHSLTLIAGTIETKDALTKQLHHLMGEFLHIHSFAVDEGVPSKIDGDTILLSSNHVLHEVKERLSTQSNVMVANRTVNHEQLDKLLKLEKGKRVLVVNDFKETALELIDTLLEIGLQHLDYIPYDSNKRYYNDIEIAITPGEMNIIPKYIPQKVDIGVRLLDVSTILKLVNHYSLTYIATVVSQRYIQSFIHLNQKLLYAEKQADKLRLHLENVVNAVDEGVFALNEKKEVTVYNEFAAKVFGLPQQEVIGKRLEELRIQKDVVAFIQRKQGEDGLFTINGIDVVVHPLELEQEKTVVVTIKNVNQAIEIEKKVKKEQLKSGLVAKYQFTHIIGSHPTIKETKKIARKLAQSELPVLIQGETGTGKELFAHAMHHSSFRNSGAFLAVNCSAITETLLESELFGYEEGAFTGAQRGGKRGLFELADGGTIFLDEIGDISPNLQARLLRVLQEKEVRRIGGEKLIPINVRVIAATNKDLQAKILKGEFRSDLYYRLNVLSLQLPSLTERKSDIPLLVEHFMSQSNQTVEIEHVVMDMLIQHKWEGNIRELKNTIDYMLTVCDGERLTLRDIPKNWSSITHSVEDVFHVKQSHLTLMEKKEYGLILDIVRRYNEEGQTASRRIIVEELARTQHFLTDQQIRHRLDLLEQQSLVTKGRGRAGTKITIQGISFLQSLQENR